MTSTSGALNPGWRWISYLAEAKLRSRSRELLGYNPETSDRSLRSLVNSDQGLRLWCVTKRPKEWLMASGFCRGAIS